MMVRVILLACLFTGCSAGSKNAQRAEIQEPDHFEIVSAEAQDWIGGRLGSGRGTIYQVAIRINKEGAYQFEKMWKDNRSYSISTRSDDNLVEEPLKSGDLLLLRADRKLMYDAEKEEMLEVRPESKPPVKYEGEALIQYTLNGVEKYIAIPAFQQLETISYP